jgi:hypothetical protein
MEELHTDSIDGGHEASYGARSRARERAVLQQKIKKDLAKVGKCISVESIDVKLS